MNIRFGDCDLVIGPKSRFAADVTHINTVESTFDTVVVGKWNGCCCWTMMAVLVIYMPF